MTARFVRLPVAAAPCVARSVSSAIGDVLRTIDASFAQPLSHVQRTPEQRSEAWIARQQRKIDDGLVAMSQG
ncbi:hypothetical protein PPH41_43595, partial [Burkholderia gladioli]|nr:hypothetical protein [Burkholderia gladioli]